MSQCANDGILLRHFGGELDDCVRITIGSRGDNDRLLASLDALTDGRNGA